MKKGSEKPGFRRKARVPPGNRNAGKGSVPERESGHPAQIAKPGCVIVGGKGSCAEWEGLLAGYPMIDSVQREDFPEHGASFVYLAHLYRGGDVPEEGSRAQREFEDFFRAIGYEYRSSGNYESRWYEGIGVHVG